jgi:hypothetical protein
LRIFPLPLPVAVSGVVDLHVEVLRQPVEDGSAEDVRPGCGGPVAGVVLARLDRAGRRTAVAVGEVAVVTDFVALVNAVAAAQGVVVQARVAAVERDVVDTYAIDVAAEVKEGLRGVVVARSRG